MRCKKVRKNLTAFLDGELAGTLREDMVNHLSGCDSCRKEKGALEGVRHTMAQVKELPSLELKVSPDAVLERARKPVPDPRGEKRPSRGDRAPAVPWIRWPVAASVSAVVIVMVAWWVFPIFRSLPLPSEQELRMAERMDLFEDLNVIRNLSQLENSKSGNSREENRS